MTIDLDRDLRATIRLHLDAGRSDSELLQDIQAAVEKLRTERASRADAAAMRAKLSYHLFVDEKGQRWRVSVVDLPDFCRERHLSESKMLELSTGGRDGLYEYKGYRRGPGSNSLLYGSPYSQTPEHEPFEDERPTERRLFKPKPQPVQYNHRSTRTFVPNQPKEVN